MTSTNEAPTDRFEAAPSARRTEMAMGEGSVSRAKELATENQIGSDIAKLRGSTPKSADALKQSQHKSLQGTHTVKVSETVDSNASIDKVRQYLRRTISHGEVDLAKLCNSAQVCSVGETHVSLADKEFFASQIEKLGNAGYSQIGFEMVPSANQKALDDYMSGKSTGSELLKEGNFGGFNYVPGGPETYLKILDAMKSYNSTHKTQIRPFGMDEPQTITDPKLVDGRDAHWANVVKEVEKQNPEAKIATYSGVGHLGKSVFQDWSNFTHETDKMGTHTVISLDSTDPAEAKKHPGVFFQSSEVLAEAARREHIHEPVAMPITRDGTQRADYAVALPWKDLPTPPVGKTVQENAEGRISEIKVPLDDGTEGKLQITFDKRGHASSVNFRQGNENHSLDALPIGSFEPRSSGGGGGGGGGGGHAGHKKEAQDSEVKEEEPKFGEWTWNTGVSGFFEDSFLHLRNRQGGEALTIRLDRDKHIKEIRANPTLLYPPMP